MDSSDTSYTTDSRGVKFGVDSEEIRLPVYYSEGQLEVTEDETSFVLLDEWVMTNWGNHPGLPRDDESIARYTRFVFPVINPREPDKDPIWKQRYINGRAHCRAVSSWFQDDNWRRYPNTLLEEEYEALSPEEKVLYKEVMEQCPKYNFDWVEQGQYHLHRAIWRECLKAFRIGKPISVKDLHPFAFLDNYKPEKISQDKASTEYTCTVLYCSACIVLCLVVFLTYVLQWSST